MLACTLTTCCCTVHQFTHFFVVYALTVVCGFGNAGCTFSAGIRCSPAAFIITSEQRYVMLCIDATSSSSSRMCAYANIVRAEHTHTRAHGRTRRHRQKFTLWRGVALAMLCKRTFGRSRVYTCVPACAACKQAFAHIFKCVIELLLRAKRYYLGHDARTSLTNGREQRGGRTMSDVGNGARRTARAA